MIDISEDELNDFLKQCITKTFKRNEIASRPNAIPNEIFFINKGLLRETITDSDGVEHSIHFALENQFMADYSSFLLKQPSIYTLKAEEETKVVVMPRAAIEWGYKNFSAVAGIPVLQPAHRHCRCFHRQCNVNTLAK